MYSRILNYLVKTTAPSEALQKYTDTHQQHNRNGQRHSDHYHVDILLFNCC